MHLGSSTELIACDLSILIYAFSNDKIAIVKSKVESYSKIEKNDYIKKDAQTCAKSLDLLERSKREMRQY